MLPNLIYVAYETRCKLAIGPRLFVKVLNIQLSLV